MTNVHTAQRTRILHGNHLNAPFHLSSQSQNSEFPNNCRPLRTYSMQQYLIDLLTHPHYAHTNDHVSPSTISKLAQITARNTTQGSTRPITTADTGLCPRLPTWKHTHTKVVLKHALLTSLNQPIYVWQPTHIKVVTDPIQSLLSSSSTHPINVWKPTRTCHSFYHSFAQTFTCP